MSTRNERKRAAKARYAEMMALCDENDKRVRDEKRQFEEARDAYCARISDALRHHKEPVVRFGTITKSSRTGSRTFVSKPYCPVEVKRKLVKSELTGKMIERKKGAI